MAVPDKIVDYKIEVSLDAKAHSLTGMERLTWKNPGDEPVSSLFFHLYPNAFHSKETTFNRESGGQLRGDALTDKGLGHIDVSSITLADGTSLKDDVRYVQPDDSNRNDRTVMEVPLSVPVQPGASVTLDLGFTVKLPQVYARMGYWGDFIMAGQWFPKLAVYEPAGWRHRAKAGWNAHQYHGNSEFYANFGGYDVAITVPKDYTVAATGIRIGEKINGDGTKTVRHVQENVHDFAWSASPDFTEYKQQLKLHGRTVEMKLYVPPSHKHLKKRYMTVTAASLKRYSEWYTVYPYDTISIVVPPAGASGAAGMEYPTLITAWDASNSNPDTSLERVVAHELGHQYFYGLLASNEFEEPWLDEGFTTYAENRLMAAVYGEGPEKRLYERSYLFRPEKLVLPAWDYHDYGVNVYTRAGLVLDALGQELGTDTMDKVMRAYAEAWKYRHPTTKDFQLTAEKQSGRDLSSFFNRYVYDNKMIDYSVKSIVETKSGGKYHYEVKIDDVTRAKQPVDIQFMFAGNAHQTKRWTPSAPSTVLTADSDKPLRYVRIDPKYGLFLESNHINNFMRADVTKAEESKTGSMFSMAIQLLLSWFGW